MRNCGGKYNGVFGNPSEYRVRVVAYSDKINNLPSHDSVVTHRELQHLSCHPLA